MKIGIRKRKGVRCYFPLEEEDELLFKHCAEGKNIIYIVHWKDVSKLLLLHGVKSFDIEDNTK